MNPGTSMMTPLVSAIVSSYNSERFMRGLLEDLERQTLADRLEIIVVDSNSPQNEGAIVRDFQKWYDNIVYLRTEERENSHVSFNRCIQMARGKYVAMANTDDRHRPDALERMAEVLEAHPEVALVYADMAVTHRENDTWQSGGPWEYCRWPDFDPQLLFQICYMGPQPMWRRDIHERHGYFDPEFWSAGDYEFWLRMARREKFSHLPEVLGLYLLSLQGNEQRDKSLSYQESERARERYWPAGWGKRPLPFNRNPFVVADPTDLSLAQQTRVLKQQAAFFFSQGDCLGAEKALRLALDRTPRDSEVLVSLGRVCFERQHFKNALTYLQQAAQESPSNREAWIGLALVAQQMNNRPLMKEAYRQARRLDSSLPAAPKEEMVSGPFEKPAELPNPKDLNDQGEALYGQGKIEAAMEQFQRSLEADPQYLPAMNNLGVASFHRGERDLAADWFRRALSLDPGYPEALENLRQCQAMGRERVPSQGSESRIEEEKI